MAVVRGAARRHRPGGRPAGRPPRPDRTELGELTRLLREAWVEEDGGKVTVTALSDRLELACRDVLATLTTVAAAVSATANRLANVEAAVAAAVVDANALAVPEDHPVAVRLSRLGRDLTEVRDEALADPLGAGPDAQRLRHLTAAIGAAGAELAELARIRATYEARAAQLAGRLADLAAAEDRARAAYDTALAKILDPGLPPMTTTESDLRERTAHLDADARAGRWLAVTDALEPLEAAVARALGAARERAAFADGLVARRDELRGRLESYRVRAQRQGRGEDAALSAQYGAVRALLWTAPCDLPAATRALYRYQQSVLGGDVA
ncbi:hypothetical protein ACFQX7_40155 [Luedemannella flava]